LASGFSPDQIPAPIATTSAAIAPEIIHHTLLPGPAGAALHASLDFLDFRFMVSLRTAP
jgi:hypothetical protein